MMRNMSLHRPASVRPIILVVLFKVFLQVDNVVMLQPADNVDLLEHVLPRILAWNFVAIRRNDDTVGHPSQQHIRVVHCHNLTWHSMCPTRRACHGARDLFLYSCMYPTRRARRGACDLSLYSCMHPTRRARCSSCDLSSYSRMHPTRRARRGACNLSSYSCMHACMHACPACHLHGTQSMQGQHAKQQHVLTKGQMHSHNQRVTSGPHTCRPPRTTMCTWGSASGSS